MDTANATIDSAMNELGSILMLIGGVAFSALNRCESWGGDEPVEA